MTTVARQVLHITEAMASAEANMSITDIGILGRNEVLRYVCVVYCCLSVFLLFCLIVIQPSNIMPTNAKMMTMRNGIIALNLRERERERVYIYIAAVFNLPSMRYSTFWCKWFYTQRKLKELSKFLKPTNKNAFLSCTSQYNISLIHFVFRL